MTARSVIFSFNIRHPLHMCAILQRNGTTRPAPASFSGQSTRYLCNEIIHYMHIYNMNKLTSACRAITRNNKYK